MMNPIKISTYSYIRKKWGKEKYIQELLEGKTKPDGLEYNPPSNEALRNQFHFGHQGSISSFLKISCLLQGMARERIQGWLDWCPNVVLLLCHTY